ncbi:MAG: DUF3010 family protein [Cyclobacteriaceae bacterium]|nr:DUF3010 family protein [Cyclobacteriaceae bacterium]
MKVLGIQIKSKEAILVILTQDGSGNIVQTDECTTFEITDIYNSNHVKQFRNQINIAFDTIKPHRIGICKRNENGKGMMAPSPVSFKLEGIIQLYDKIDVEFVAPQTTKAFLKKNTCSIVPSKKYQQDAFDVAYYLLTAK